MFYSTPGRVVLPLVLALGLTSCSKQLKADLDAAKSSEATCQQELAAAKQALSDSKSKFDKLQGDKNLADARLAAYRDIAQKLRDAFGDESLALEIRNGRLILKLPNAILYDSGSATLKDEGKTALKKVAGVLRNVEGRNFIIAGHTDTTAVKAGASFKTNYELSTKRALSAVYYLETSGVKPTQLAAAGYGEHQPLVANDTDENKAKNRRTEIVIMPTLAEIPKMPKEI